MLSPLDLLIIALATFYASYVLVHTKGPWGVFEKVRAAFPLGGLTTCIYCCAIWFAVAFYLLSLSPIAVVSQVFAVAGGAMLLFRFTGGSHV